MSILPLPAQAQLDVFQQMATRKGNCQLLALPTQQVEPIRTAHVIGWINDVNLRAVILERYAAVSLQSYVSQSHFPWDVAASPYNREGTIQWKASAVAHDQLACSSM